MSVHALSVVLGTGSDKSRSDADGYVRLVLIAVANIVNDRGFGWARTITVARGASVHRGTVNRRLDDLIALGELRMFTRGHYQAPVYVMTMVDHPLSDEEIRSRLSELDHGADWVERVPGQRNLPLGRSSQTATISQNDGVSVAPPAAQPSDQGLRPSEGRENGQSSPDPEIVADSDDPSRSATGTPKHRRGARPIVAVARRSSEPKRDISTTTTTTGTPLVAERDNPSGSRGDDHPPPDLTAARWARRWCELTGKVFTGPVRSRYTLQVAEFITAGGTPTDGFLRQAAAAGIIEPSGWGFITTETSPVVLPDCDVCDNRRLRGVLDDGTLVAYDDPHTDANVVCGACQPGLEPA